MRKSKSQKISKALGLAVILASQCFALGSVSMSSTYSVLNFSNTQTILNRAADALRSYLVIAAVWAFATCLILFSVAGWLGVAFAFAANILINLWVYLSYRHAFKEAVKQHALKMPCVLFGKHPLTSSQLDAINSNNDNDNDNDDDDGATQ